VHGGLGDDQWSGLRNREVAGSGDRWEGMGQ
jgi:hypothetical protein